MARTNKRPAQKKSKSKQAVTRVRSRVPRPVAQYGDTLSVRNHVNMVVDPCEAELVPTAYRGQSGFLQRFSTVTTWSPVGTDTAGVIALQPGWGGSWSTTAAAAATTLNVAWGSGAPGATFLTSNADAFRAVGACVDVDYIGTELNRSGYITAAIVPNTFMAQGTALNVGWLQSAATIGGRLRDTTHSFKWIPGSEDENYLSTGLGGNGVDSANTLVIAVSGCPAGMQLTFRTTIIYEWLPRNNMGMPAPAVLGHHNVVGGYERIINALSQIPSAWQNLTEAYHKGKKMVAIAAQAYQGGQKIIEYAERTAPLMLTM